MNKEERFYKQLGVSEEGDKLLTKLYVLRFKQKQGLKMDDKINATIKEISEHFVLANPLTWTCIDPGHRADYILNHKQITVEQWKRWEEEIKKEEKELAVPFSNFYEAKEVKE